jgi:hypothetical protein
VEGLTLWVVKRDGSRQRLTGKNSKRGGKVIDKRRYHWKHCNIWLTILNGNRRKEMAEILSKPSVKWCRKDLKY